MSQPPRLIVICGATATGKSGLALQLAERLGSVILSADSRLVYREFDIGTAKPTREERQRVPHYLIDICEPTETLTVADYQDQAQHLIAKASESPPLLLVGGTGLYIKSIVRGMKIPRVAPQLELRSQLEALGQFQCYQILQQIDPMAAQKIHANDQVRTLRALEVYYITGRPISEQQGENPPDYPILQIGLHCEPDALTSRIKRRTEEMIEKGFVQEVEQLCQKYGTELSLLETLGYQEIKQYLAGDISLETAKELTVLHTRQFAKRQRTWFRAISEIQWFDADSSQVLDEILKSLIV
ncbi:tRNA (adenosine(37)-N6)-dimethylallyltransferase MiaA [Planktothrix mougeotii LEGE 06226]|uniref:tRNA dimethylallyltransferase n=1 Tax=Planktothrix mougeotii LEGE 06226 TaxID=1828728 RepID=A0ABR9U7D9_9CYAN|nr:tRNA (adenosine(37)-N6)-dimethylallyltransferase MiaA [Planktothrix mougeotii LEGE 06226]